MKQILFYLGALAIGLSFWMLPANDPDLGWHLTGGGWIVQSGALAQDDIVNTFSAFWHDYHWLGQIALYKLYSVGGYETLRIALGLTMAALFLVVVNIILRSSRGRIDLVTILFFLATFVLIRHVTSVRLQALSLLAFALTLQRLIQAPRKWELPYLFVLTVITVNIHVYWVLIPFLWLLYRALPRLYRKRTSSSSYAWSGFLLLCLAGFVSPYGLIPAGIELPSPLLNYAVLWDYLTMPLKLKETIGEFRGSLASEQFTPWVVLLVLVYMVRSFSLKHAKVRLPQFLTALVFGFLAIRGLKFVSLFAVGMLPWCISLRRDLFGANLTTSARLSSPLLSALLAIGVTSSYIHYPGRFDNDDQIYDYCPIDACRAISDLNFDSKRGHVRVLTHFNYGGWCRWAAFEKDSTLDLRVTTDGRTQGIPPEHFLRSYDVFNLKGDWFRILRTWNPDVVLAHKSSALANFMIFATSHWHLAYQDRNFAVFTPVKKLRLAVS